MSPYFAQVISPQGIRLSRFVSRNWSHLLPHEETVQTKYGPTVFRLNRLKPTVFRLNRLKPTVFRLNRLKPTVFRVNSLKPTVFRLNSLKTTVFRLNSLKPAGSTGYLEAGRALEPRGSLAVELLEAVLPPQNVAHTSQARPDAGLGLSHFQCESL